MRSRMSKQLYNFTQTLFQKNRQGGRIKNSALATKLHEEYHFGQFDFNQQWLSFSLDNILMLSYEIQDSLGLDIRHDTYPSKEDRLTTAETNRNEKDNSYAVSKDFILINSLSALSINQTCHQISPLTSLGSYIKAEDIVSVEHSAIVLVENLAVMANLDLINLSSFNINASCENIDLTQALWLYRGDVKAQQTTNTSYQFFRRFKGKIPLICFSDLDPKGIEIALTSHADYWLTVENTNEIIMPLAGDEQEWYKQGASIDFLLQQIQNLKQDQAIINQTSDINKSRNRNDEKIACWQNTFNTLLTHKKTLKQEHMIKHKLALTLLEMH